MDSSVNQNGDKASSESESEEIQCPVKTHEGKQMLDMILPFSADYIYSLLFTDSKWFQDFLISRNTKDIVHSDWQHCAETGEKLRQMTYTVALNLAIAKSARSTEFQKIIVEKENEVYVIDTDISNSGIPYSESFSIKSHNCITKISKKRCRYRIFSQINYKKSVWGLVKTVIEKNAMQGAIDFCVDLEKALKQLSGNVPSIQQQQTEVRQSTRIVQLNQESNPPILSIESPREINFSTTTSTNVSQSLIQESKSRYSSTEFAVKAMLALLALLLLLNMLLILKLGSLEDLSIRLNSFPDQLLTDTPAESIPSLSRGEFLLVLRKQEILHRTEISKWQESLGDMLKLFHAIETSLLDLKTAVDAYSGSVAIKSVISHGMQDSVPSNAQKEK